MYNCLSAARAYAKTHLLPERVLCYYYRALETYAARQQGVPTVTEDMVWIPPPQGPKYNTCNSPDPLSQLGAYPIVPLHPASFEKTLNSTGKVGRYRVLRHFPPGTSSLLGYSGLSGLVFTIRSLTLS